MPDVAARSDVLTLDNFIGGRWVKARATDFFDVHNPAVGDIIGRTPLSTAADVDAAVQAATIAFPAWRDTPVNTRAQVLYKFKARLEAHFDEVSRIVTTEHGKTLDEARGSVRRARVRRARSRRRKPSRGGGWTARSSSGCAPPPRSPPTGEIAASSTSRWAPSRMRASPARRWS